MLRRFVIVLTIAAVLAAAGVLIWRVMGGSSQPPGNEGQPSSNVSSSPLETLADASGWINGTAQTPDSARGGPVLIVVWADTDPVSLRRLPEVQVWHEAYGRFDLRVIGVHEPEFAFATDQAVVARTLDQLRVRFPMALDAGYKIGPRLGAMDGLPAWVLVDPEGRRVFATSGDRVRAVHYALLELLSRRYPEAVRPSEPPEDEHQPAVSRVFFGTSRVKAGPLVGAVAGQPRVFTAQFRYQEEGEANTPYVVGRWTPGSDGVTSARGGATDYAAVRYHGGTVDAVLSAARGEPHRVWVLCDDAWLPDSLAGPDVRRDARGASYVEVAEPRIYSVARSSFGHVLKLSPDGPGVTFYDFVITSP